MGHLSKDMASHFDASLMFRLIRAGLCVPLFTEKQKLVLLNIARVSCPQDLAPFVFYPQETDEGVPATPVQATNATKELTAYPTPSSTDSPLISRNKTVSLSPLTSDDFFKDWRQKQERQSYELKIKDLEAQLVTSQRATSQLTKDIQGRDQELVLLKVHNTKMKGRFAMLKAVIQSLERRNAELEYANLTKKTLSKGGHWGSQGLWMEYQTWADVWNTPEN
jgi:hypothetical protein